jgi:hypothetical protein
VKSAPTVLAILSLPAAAIGYAATVAVLNGLDLPSGVGDVLLIFLPLFVAALCMVPFLLPLFDRMAKRDLEAHRAQQATSEGATRDDATADPPQR